MLADERPVAAQGIGRAGRRGAVGTVLAGAALTLTACAGGPSVEPVGFHEFRHASGGDADALCAAFAGETADLSDLFGVELTYSEGTEGGCLYETADGAYVALGVDDGTMTEWDLSATSGTFTTGVVASPPRPPVFMDAAKLQTLQEWVDARAAAVLDDYDDWLATLPEAEETYLALGGYELDPLMLENSRIELASTLVTPTVDIDIHGSRQVDYLQLEDPGALTRAGHERVFLVASLGSSAHREIDGADRTVHVRVDGVDGTPFTLDPSDLADLVLSIPADATDVALVVTTNDDAQEISLIDGTIHDDGRGERYDARTSDMLHCDLTYPQVRQADGTPKERRVTAFDRYITAHHVPWTAGSGWAPDGETYLTLALHPYDANHALPREASDARVTVAGTEHGPLEVDGENHSYTFLVPETPEDVRAEIAIHPDGAALVGQYQGWQEGDTVTAPGRLDCTIPAPEL
ncbi:hypothetical protein [Actinotalea sp. C106]|uniref:hypothetical protein n=1 Tax=Actinotalea sp. C106 TaxID=2908644 RepID=UPI002027703A|nr:hypothetical protein [Actinotalea sp. C106]